jgi:hypothetical protein
LALQLGKTVAELSQQMTAAEETSWIAYARSDPFGDDRADLRSAQVCQILWNSNVKKEDTRKITDFLPFYRKPVKKDSNVSKSVRSVFSKFINRKE